MNSQDNLKKAQGILEHVFLLCVVIAALLVIGYFVRNSISGRARDTADVFGQGDVYKVDGSTSVTRSITNSP